jgi:heat shock protein HslJ
LRPKSFSEGDVYPSRRKTIRKFTRLTILAIFLTLFLLVAAACKPAATPTPTFSLQDVIWKWISVTNQTTRETTPVPNPENYTIIFNANGTIEGKADCNNFGGTYSQQSGGITIRLGQSTMAYCGDSSLDQQYLNFLGSVVAGGPAGDGNLALEWAGGEQRMLFQDGGPTSK